MHRKLDKRPKGPRYGQEDAEDQQGSCRTFKVGWSSPVSRWRISHLLRLRRWRCAVACRLGRRRLRQFCGLSAGWAEISRRWNVLTASHTEHGGLFLPRNIALLPFIARSFERSIVQHLPAF